MLQGQFRTFAAGRARILKRSRSSTCGQHHNFILSIHRVDRRVDLGVTKLGLHTHFKLLTFCGLQLGIEIRAGGCDRQESSFKQGGGLESFTV